MSFEYSSPAARYEKLDVKLEVLNEQAWLKCLKVQLRKSEVGNVILKDKEMPAITIPTMDDFYINPNGTTSSIPLYPESAAKPAIQAKAAIYDTHGTEILPEILASPLIPGQLTHEAFLRLIHDKKIAKQAIKHRNRQECELIAYLQSQISDQQLSRLELNSDFIKHRDDQNSFQMFKTIMSVILCITSLLIVMVRINSFFGTTQGSTSFSDFCKKIEEGKVRLPADLEDPIDPTDLVSSSS